MKIVTLLTGCINPDGMAYTALNNIEERQMQYVNAIRFYLKETNYPIVFCENSGTDISYLFQDSIDSGRFECLSFYGNQNKEKGKGYGEAEIIEYALNNSNLIRSVRELLIVKITGRLIVKNIAAITLLHSFIRPRKTVYFAINSNLSFPDSRFIIAPVSFYSIFINTKTNICDSKGYYFEHALLDTIKSETQFIYTPFLLMPRIEGISGTTGELYHTTHNSITFILKYAKYAFIQKKRFNKIRKNL